MTIKELRDLCNTEIKRNNGNRKVFLSDDEEGNGYHELFYSFLVNSDEIADIQKYSFGLEEENPDKIAILG